MKSRTNPNDTVGPVDAKDHQAMVPNNSLGAVANINLSALSPPAPASFQALSIAAMGYQPPAVSLERLAAPFPPEVIQWRVGSTTKDKSRGMALAYIDARDVQDRLNEVCGVYWQAKHHNCGGDKLACEIGIKIGDEWVWRGDGAGSTDVEGEKGAFSDSFKRAAVRWGIGRHLYDLDAPWVQLEAKGNTHVIKASEFPKLRRAALEAKFDRNAPSSPEPPPGRAPFSVLMPDAKNAAAKGADALRAFWGGLENRERLAICLALRADPAKGCPASLKTTAEEADAKQHPLNAQAQHATSSAVAQYAEKQDPAKAAAKGALREMLERSAEEPA
jgi:Rad52/22 family double-strand break repair protein